MIVAVITILLVFILFAWSISKMFEQHNNKKQQMSMMKEERQSRTYVAKLDDCEIIEGLEVSVKSSCNVTLTRDELIISCVGIDYNLSRSRILGAALKMANELTGAVSANIGGAVAGGLLFGGVGAIVGGMSSSERENRRYLIVNYLDKQNEIKVLCIYIKGKPYNFTSDPVERSVHIEQFNYELAKLTESLCKIDVQKKISVDL